MVMIVTIHAYGHGSGLNYDYLYSLGADCSTAYHLGLFSLGKCGVTGFMFISGYYGISLKWKKLVNMIVMLGFYLMLLAIIGGDSIIATIKVLLHPWDEWWFVSSYIVICLLSPFINNSIAQMTERQLCYILLGLLFYEYVGQFVAMGNSHDTIFLLTVFLCARYTRLYITPPILRKKKLCIMTFVTILSGAILCLSPIAFSMMGISKLNQYFISNNNIVLLIFTASIVIVLDSKRTTNKYINYLATSTLAIYLLTDNFVVRKPLDTWLLKEIISGVNGYVCLLIVVVICLLIDKIRGLLFDGVKMIITKINVN